jgi:digeranylgeranylglycerophospholipid reductase
MKDRYDVVVVGAGPAGSVAARLAAEGGASVLLVEKRQEIGTPVRCAEAVGVDLMRAFIEPSIRWIDAEIGHFSIFNSQGQSVSLPPAEPTVVVNRKVFDFELALLAARAGAEVCTSTAAVGLDLTGGQVCGVRLDSLGREQQVACRLVVAADGVESQVGRWAGLKTVPPQADYFQGLEFLAGGLKGQIDLHGCEYHLDQALAPGGYLWVFPKGEDLANVGLVISADRARPGAALAALEQFCARRFTGWQRMAVISGGIPVSGALKQLTANGLVVVGDAAHQADPLTAGGINLGMIAAQMAIQAALPALARGDVSAAGLAEYERQWQKRFGKMHEALYRIRKIVGRLGHKRLDELVLEASRLPLAEMSLGQILFSLLKKDPLLLFEARTLVSTGLILK